MHFYSTNSLYSQSIWGVLLSPHDNLISLKAKPFADAMFCPSPLSLKGGNGEEGDSTPDTLFSNFIKALVFTPLYQPFKVIRFLMQYGYEPVSPYTRTGRGFMDFLMDRPESKYVYLPGIIGYTRGLVQMNGKGCLCAGIGPSFLHMLVDTFAEAILWKPVNDFINNLVELNIEEERVLLFNPKRVLTICMKSTIISTVNLILGHPFFVVGNVNILRCIKGEPSVWIWSLFREVWDEAGIGGFYSGLFAMWLYQMVNLWCEELAIEVFRMILVKINEGTNEKNRTADYTIAHLIISSFTYPLCLVSNIMTANKCSAKNSSKFPQLPIFSSWVACFRHSYNVGIWFRGSSVLTRRLLYVES